MPMTESAGSVVFIFSHSMMAPVGEKAKKIAGTDGSEIAVVNQGTPATQAGGVALAALRRRLVKPKPSSEKTVRS